jgi:diacylglycerol kinase family enzyme
VDLGRMNGRRFVFAAGVGLDASVVERVDDHPYRKARFGAWYYTYAAVAIFSRRYLVRPPHVRVRTGDRTLDGVTVIVQNSDPFTFFRRRPIRVTEPAGLDTGSLSAAVLKSATPLELPTLIPRLPCRSTWTTSASTPTWSSASHRAACSRWRKRSRRQRLGSLP